MTNITVNHNGELVDESTGNNIDNIGNNDTTYNAYEKVLRVSNALTNYTRSKNVHDILTDLDEYWNTCLEFMDDEERETNTTSYDSLTKDIRAEADIIHEHRADNFIKSENASKVKLSAMELKYVQGSTAAKNVLTTNLETGIHQGADIVDNYNVEEAISALSEKVEEIRSFIDTLMEDNDEYQQWKYEMEYEDEWDDDWDEYEGDWDEYEDGYEDEWYDDWDEYEDEDDTVSGTLSFDDDAVDEDQNFETLTINLKFHQ